MIPLWLHKEGNWYILDREQSGPDMHPYPHQSLIWHQCPKPEKASHFGGVGYKGMWRLSERSLNLPCGVCDEVCPDGLAGLWRMHNWETLDDLHFGAWDGSFYLHGTTKRP